jgi:TetR/AcrR family transcriptional regulator
MSLPEPITPQRTPQGAQTAERILDAAELLFSERGFEGTGLREVARAAGIRAPSLYNHFPNKEALYAAVLERAFQPLLRLLEAFQAGRDESYTDPRLLEDVMGHLARHPNVSRLLHYELMAGGRRANAVLQGWLGSMYRNGLAALAGSPESGPWQTDELPRLLFTMANVFTGYFAVGPAYAGLLGGDPLAPESIERQTRFLRKLWQVLWGTWKEEV